MDWEGRLSLMTEKELDYLRAAIENRLGKMKTIGFEIAKLIFASNDELSVSVCLDYDKLTYNHKSEYQGLISQAAEIIDDKLTELNPPKPGEKFRWITDFDGYSYLIYEDVVVGTVYPNNNYRYWMVSKREWIYQVGFDRDQSKREVEQAVNLTGE